MKGRRKAQRYLEQMQWEAYSYLGMENIQKEIEKQNQIYIKEIPNMIEQFKQQCSRLPPDEAKSRMNVISKSYEILRKIKPSTKYEDIVWYGMMQSLITDLQSGLSHIQFDTVEQTKDYRDKMHKCIQKTVFGTLPTGQVNAKCIEVPNSDNFIIIMEPEIFTFCNLFSKLVALSMPMSEKQYSKNPMQLSMQDYRGYSIDFDKIRLHIAENKEISQRFNNLIISYLIHGRPSLATPYIMNQFYQPLADILRDSMELYIVSHELSHIISGHFERDISKIRKFLKEDDHQNLYYWYQELEADRVGFYLTLAAMAVKKDNLPLSFGGPPLFLEAMNIVEKAKCILTHGHENLEWDSPSHPPPELRLEIMKDFVKNEYGEHISLLTNSITEIIKILWKPVSGDLKEMYQKGNKMDSRFRQP